MQININSEALFEKLNAGSNTETDNSRNYNLSLCTYRWQQPQESIAEKPLIRTRYDSEPQILPNPFNYLSFVADREGNFWKARLLVDH